MIPPVASVQLPERMQKLDRDPRGYPIFYMAYRDKHGRPHFTINDEVKRQHVIKHDLCSICGEKLLRGRWFVGGEKSAFHERGCYLDPPMHAECVHYALRVCPYMSAPNWSRYIEDSTLAPDDNLATCLDPAMSDKRPDVFVAVLARGQRKMMGEMVDGPIKVPFVQYLKPLRPYIKVELWRRGERIDLATALHALDDDGLQALGHYVSEHGPVNRLVDVSDIPEAGEEWFKRAKLVLPDKSVRE
jgi:hypothetical protein